MRTVALLIPSFTYAHLFTFFQHTFALPNIFSVFFVDSEALARISFLFYCCVFTLFDL